MLVKISTGGDVPLLHSCYDGIVAHIVHLSLAQTNGNQEKPNPNYTGGMIDSPSKIGNVSHNLKTSMGLVIVIVL